jgi:hypothetical protein
MNRIVGATLILGSLAAHPVWCSLGRIERLPRPAVGVLRALAVGNLTETAVTDALRDCAALDPSLSRCRWELREVLQVVSADDEKLRVIVEGALRTGLRSPEAKMRKVAEMVLDEGRSEAANRTSATQAGPGQRCGEPEGPSAVLPPPNDIMTLGRVRYYDALRAALLAALPCAPRERVAQAMAIAAASSCEELPLAVLREHCLEGGFMGLQYGAWLVVLPRLYESKGDSTAVDEFLAVDRVVLTKALERASFDEDLSPVAEMLQKWLIKRPSRWEAWADLLESE